MVEDESLAVLAMDEWSLADPVAAIAAADEVADVN